MSKAKPIVTIRRKGRTISLRPEVLTWRKRMAAFYPVKAKILELVLDAHQGDATRAYDFLRQPMPELKGATPLSLIKPHRVRSLYATLRRKLLAPSTTV